MKMNLEESYTVREENEQKSATTMAHSSSNTKGEIFPFDITLNILKRVPAKSLIRFKCVAKDWNNLIENPYFIADHLHQSLQNNNPFLLLQRISRPFLQSQPQTSSICLIEPDLKVQNPQFMDFASSDARVVGSCNGLLCVRHTNHTISLWNPATRQIREVHGTLIDINNFYFVGFGFSPIVNDYKIVRISVSEFYEENQFMVIDDVSVNQVEVYSLTKGSWKEIDASNMKNLRLMSNSVTTNGVMSWMATLSDSDDPDVEYVVLFDIGEEVFKVLKGPPPPPSSSHCHSILAVNHNKLAMFHHFMMGNFESSSVDLWVLDDGVSWIKKYSIGPFSGILYPLSIWGDEIVCNVELPREDGGGGYSGVRTVLSLYNPYSRERKNLPRNSDKYYYAAFNYTESLVPVANIHYEQ